MKYFFANTKAYGIIILKIRTISGKNALPEKWERNTHYES